MNKALTLLGEATRDLVGDVTNTDSGAVLAWKLVSVFCRVHGLKTSIALLQELARRNDCITFLTKLSANGSCQMKLLILF